MKPTGTTPRRAHVAVPDDEDLDPMEHRADGDLPPDTGEEDLDPRDAPANPPPHGANPPRWTQFHPP